MGLVSELYRDVEEGPSLWEIGLPVAEWGPGWHRVLRGPWDLDSCAQVLLAWFDAGWIGLACSDIPAEWGYELPEWFARTTPDGHYHDLAATDARALLSQPERWRSETADRLVTVYVTAAGAGRSAAEWCARTKPLS